MRVLVTGGAGFIGSALVTRLLDKGFEVLNLDALTYAADSAVADWQAPGYRFLHVDICDAPAVGRALSAFDPNIIMHLAAESHVDRSIDGPGTFLRTNIDGTFTMLQAAVAHWRGLSGEARERFRFHHVSTDEVYGDLAPGEPAFTETTPYNPSSPYSASKAASDHLARAWYRTYELPVVISNCSNNYGPRQFPEKLIPLMILNALEGRPLPIYGDGQQVRDWLHVDDHAEALVQVALRGNLGETYNIGGRSERSNIEVVTRLCEILEEERPMKPQLVSRYADLITWVTDRPGHDRRYAIDDGKLERELGVTASREFEDGLRQTVRWYLDNLDWCARIRRERYDQERIGLVAGGEAAAA